MIGKNGIGYSINNPFLFWLESKEFSNNHYEFCDPDEITLKRVTKRLPLSFIRQESNVIYDDFDQELEFDPDLALALKLSKEEYEQNQPHSNVKSDYDDNVEMAEMGKEEELRQKAFELGIDFEVFHCFI